MDDILKEFLAESWENLSRLDTEIVELERRPSDAALLASIFRTIHTIKGTTGFLGLENLGAVAHSGENVLGQMRNGTLSATPAAISLVLESVDAIKELLTGLEQTGNEPTTDHSDLIARLDRLAEGHSPEPALPAAVEAVPALHPVAAPPAAVAAPETNPMPAPALAAAKPVESVPQVSGSSEIKPVVYDDLDDQPEEQGEARKSVADLSIRVNVDVVDRLMNLVGELVLTRNQLLQMVRGDDESKYAAPITHLNRVTTDLQEGVMKTRMQPIGNAWSKLPRLVRDLARITGKQIELEMTGAETELDRTVLDSIKDPLTHMVRNSADHGIESMADRRARGKSETGHIRLHAYHEGGHVIISIQDDGAGISIDRVRQKAIANGLVQERDAVKLSDKEVLQFIFLPGFSTAEKVTSVSGRGVGMDVVRTQIERIGGVVDLTSRPGQGTTIRIKIPLTLAIISALVVESGGLSFAIPQLGVVELVRLPEEDRHKIERINKNEVFRLRNRLLPLVHLDRVLKLDDRARESAVRDVNIVVVQVGDEQFGLIVDEVFDTEEIVVKPVGALLKTINVYQGTTILGDGRVIMILDVAGVASQVGGINSSNGTDRDARRDEGEGQPTTSLLVVDAGGSNRMAVPLSLVARLEEFPRSQIERTGERLVVQYRGKLLPLLPIAGVRDDNPPDPQPVVVFSEGDKSMGLMVHQIQDILEEQLTIRMHSQRTGVLGTAIIAGRATDLIDTNYYVMQAHPSWFARQSRSTSARKVLVVDDSVFIRQLTTTALEMEGFQVKAVDSAEAALKALDAGLKVQAIVSDIEMPGMDGFQLARILRERFPDLPLMALTSLGSGNVETRAMAAGFDKYQPKFNAKLFVDAVSDLCTRHVSDHGGVGVSA